MFPLKVLEFFCFVHCKNNNQISGYIPHDEPDRIPTHSPYIHTAVSPTNNQNSAYPNNIYSQNSQNITYPNIPLSEKSVYQTNPYSDNSAHSPNHYISGNSVYPTNYYAHSSQSNESTNSTSQSTVVSLKQQQIEQNQHLQPHYNENEWTPCSTPTINSYIPSITSSTLTMNSSSPVINTTSSNMNLRENLHYNSPSPYNLTAQQTSNVTQPTRRSASIGAPNTESIRLPPRSPYMNNSMYSPHPIAPTQPPAPPPRDFRRRLVLHTDEDSGRPMSYSFETNTYTPTIARCRSSERLQTSALTANQAGMKPLESHLSVPDLNKSSHVDDCSTRTTTTATTLVSGVYKPPSLASVNTQQTTCPPKRGDVLIPEQRQTCASPMYVDSEPRSRRPIQLYASAPVLYPPPASSPGPINAPKSVSNSHKVYYNNYHPNIHPMNTLTISDLDISAEEFWAPHSGRLATASVSPACSDNLVSDDRNIKTPNRDSAIVSNVSTPPLLQNCDSQCVSEKSGKSSPTSVSSKDSGCSESGIKQLILAAKRPTARQQLQAKQKSMLDLDLAISKSSSESTLPGMLKYLIFKSMSPFSQKQRIN